MTQYSDRKANERAVPAVLNARSLSGRAWYEWFEGTIVTAGGLAVGTLIDLVTLPKGARVLGGLWGNDATFSGAGVTLNIGFSGAAAKFASALDCSGLNNTAIANTLALGLGYVLTQDELIYVTTAVDVIVDTGTYWGYFILI
jgi:hypothetical protein